MNHQFHIYKVCELSLFKLLLIPSPTSNALPMVHLSSRALLEIWAWSCSKSSRNVMEVYGGTVRLSRFARFLQDFNAKLLNRTDHQGMPGTDLRSPTSKLCLQRLVRPKEVTYTTATVTRNAMDAMSKTIGWSHRPSHWQRRSKMMMMMMMMQLRNCQVHTNIDWNR